MAQWEAELAELVTRRSGALVGYAYSLTRDKPQAEDLVQDALVKVYSRLRRPPSAGGQARVDLDRPEATNAEGYVRRAILTIYLDGYRRRNHWSGLKHLLADDELSPGADRVATARVDVGTALKQLSPRQREAVMMRFFDDLTVPQIAAALGTSQGTIKRHLFDATAVLRQALADVSVPAMDTSLDERLDAVAGAVRRRRTAKVGAVAGVSMVLAIALAWGAFAVKPWIRSEPLPADDKVEYTPGYVPVGWSADYGLYCGMTVEELDALDAGTFEVEVTGDLTPVANGTTSHWELPVTISGTVPASVSRKLGTHFITDPFVLWIHEGRVVDFVGAGWHGGGLVQAALFEAGTWSGTASAENSTSCREETYIPNSFPIGELYANERQGAGYELRVAAVELRAQKRSDGATPLVISDSITVDLDSGVAPAPTFPPPSDDCSGATYASRDLAGEGLSEETLAFAELLLEAVTTCDSRRVAELGKGITTCPWLAWSMPSVNEVFALPETDGETPYAAVARLLTETGPARNQSASGWVWPRVAGAVTGGDDDAAWEEAINAGAISQEQAAADRAEGIYTGWRLSISDYIDEPEGEDAPGVRWTGFYDYEGADEWCSTPAAESDPQCE
jgi:RNA polymerase sigma factor (sigma-70 family)